MQRIFSEYLNKFLGQFFLSYPKDQMIFLYEHFLGIKDTLTKDIESTHPDFESINPDGNNLFELLQLNPSLEAIFYYRIERSIFNDDPQNEMLLYLANLMRLKTNIEIFYSTEIGSGFNMKHGSGIVIGPRCKIGNNFLIRQGVTLGSKGELPGVDIEKIRVSNSVIVGDNVKVFAGAKILGQIHVGDNTVIAANAVLTHDAEPNSIYAGVPARKIKHLDSSNITMLEHSTL